MATLEMVKLADRVPELETKLTEIHDRRQKMEIEERDRRDRFSIDLAKIDGEVRATESELRNAGLARQRIRGEVAPVIADAVDRAGVAVRAHAATIDRARRERDAAKAILIDRTEKGATKDQITLLTEQVAAAEAEYRSQLKKLDDLKAAESKAMAEFEAAVSTIRKRTK